MRDRKRIHRIIDKLAIVWYRNPDQRLGQLINNISSTKFKRHPTVGEIFNIEDDEWEALLTQVEKHGWS